MDANTLKLASCDRHGIPTDVDTSPGRQRVDIVMLSVNERATTVNGCVNRQQ